MFFKICGITRTDDAIFAHDQGADMIGVVLSEQSPRRGTQAIIRQISMEGISTAAVYTDMTSAMKQVAYEEFAQLHFNSTSEEVNQIRETGRKVISVMDVRNGIDPKHMEDTSCRSDLILLENRNGISGTLKPGTIDLSDKTGLAGGIGVDNIHEILRLNPGFIDLSSSLESSPGIKDRSKIKRFFQEVNGH